MSPTKPNWPEDPLTRLGPFTTASVGEARSLRVTLDTSGTQSTEDEVYALSLIRELARLPELDVLDTTPGERGWIDVPLDVPARHYTVTTKTDTGEPARWTGIDEWEFWSATDDVERGGHLYRKLAQAAAHASATRDLFVTIDPALLRTRRRLTRANIVSPTEALPLIHLYLRHRNRFVFKTTGGRPQTIGRGWFFLVALRAALPNLWHCIWRTSSIPQLDERLLNLGNAVRTKCLRCLEAREELAQLFYGRDPDGDRSRYHFGYAMLLLSGALDALAKFAFLIYEPPATKHFEKRKRDASFHRSDFRVALINQGLGGIGSADFQSFLELVRRPRNRIHAEEYHAYVPSTSHSRTVQPWIGIDDEDYQTINAAAIALGGLERFGLDRIGGRLDMNPYIYTTALLKLGLDFIEEIAQSMDFSRHPGYEHARDRPGPTIADTDPFNEETLRRIRCLAALDVALALSEGP
jgi:hypothetical protein